jgi:phosphate:Na+ symporter
MVRTGIVRAYGNRLQLAMGRSTGSSLRACSMGLVVASLLQSSTATALLAVSFVSQGLIAVAAGLAIMLGADIGSTLVVQVLSFDISWLSPVLILAGVVSFLTGRTSNWRQNGRILVGLGLMLLSLSLVVGASEVLRESETLSYVLAPLAADPILAVMIGAAIAWLSHSSVAIVLLIMALIGSGVIALPVGFALVLGANVGSGIIPVVLTLSENPVARRVPLGNLGFRAIGALVAVPFLPFVVEFMPLLGSAPARQIANFHTIFNIALTLVFLPTTALAAGLLERFLPLIQDDKATFRTKVQDDKATFRTKYLDPSVISTPAVALACATRETMRMASRVETMLRDVIKAFDTDDVQDIKRISEIEDEVDTLHETIKLYLTRLSRNPMSDGESQQCMDLISYTTNLEYIGDVIDKNLLEMARSKLKDKLSFSEEGWNELRDLHERTVQQMQLSTSVFVSRDLDTARRLLASKDDFREAERVCHDRHIARLRSGQVESLQTSSLHLDILRDVKRINYYLTSVAYPILDAQGELRQSRLKVPAKAGNMGSFEERKAQGMA